MEYIIYLVAGGVLGIIASVWDPEVPRWMGVMIAIAIAIGFLLL